jgi:hypothetical protein
MKTTDRNSTKLSLSATVEMLCQDTGALAADDGSAVDLAARRLERVLVRGGNLRLAPALAALAQELVPVSSGTKRQPQAERALFALTA